MGMAHDHFQTVEGQLNWNAPMFKLYEKAKRNGKWDPAEIDFSRDKTDYGKMTDDEKMVILPLIASFAGGEEAVTIDILPMVQALARQGRLEDTLYLTTFMFDEAKHTELFSRWQREIGIGGINLSAFHGDSYKRIFYEELPERMERLYTDDSPEAIIRAATIYNMVVEGILAETGYYSFRQIFKKAGLFPGILRGIDYLNRDEGRHLHFGIYTIQRLIAGNEKNFLLFIGDMDELWPHAYGVIDYLTTLYELQMAQEWVRSSLVFDAGLMREYAKKQFAIRKRQVERGRRYENAAELDEAWGRAVERKTSF
ncbi:MAG: R2-like ligand-binding oxidase [Caldibacillus debilis]|uniref:R2-like ligand-binding oxidase n=1 Tax=Caldibacillus debilis TaxID=301148 RepID=UPI000E3AB346|nr:R2-like ligand-binding oxidase [Caldibacillus debilis]REJ13968.1 MAG: R2-like ligand-binding oxidase [Caldibacillus debilis]